MLVLSLILGYLTLYMIFIDIMSIKGYISDEQWYVASAINMARRIWGIDLPSREKDFLIYTVVFSPGSECSKDSMLNMLEDMGVSYTIVKADYEKLNAIAIGLPSSALKALKHNNCVTDLFPGIAPDEENINNYMNWEHPPLAKYVLVLSMLLLGNNELAWRLPSFLLALTMWTIMVILVYRLSGRGLGFILSALVLVAGMAFDRSFTILSSIAMLDIYVASLTVLALWASVRKSPLLSAVLIGLAGSAKFTGFFAIPWLYVVSRWSGKSTEKSLLISLFVPLLTYVVICLPIIVYLGPSGWISEVIGALKWHTTSRGEGPPSTSAWGLLIGDTPFPLYYVGWLLYLYVNSTPAVTVVAAVSGLGAAIALFRRVKDVYLPSMLFVSIATGYFLVYIAGNHTLYSFYSAHFMPVALIAASLFPLPRSDQLDEALRVVRSLIRGEIPYNSAIPEIHRVLQLVSERPTIVSSGLASMLIVGYVWFTASSIPGCDYGLDTLFCRIDEKVYGFVLAASVAMYTLFAVREAAVGETYVHTLLVLTPILLFTGLPDAYTLFLPLLFAAHRIGLNTPILAVIVGIMAPSYAYAYLATNAKSLLGFMAGHTIMKLLTMHYMGETHLVPTATDVLGLLIGLAGYVLLQRGSPPLEEWRGRAMLSPLALIPHFTPLLIEPYIARSISEGRFLVAATASLLTILAWSYASDNILLYSIIFSLLSIMGVVLGYAKGEDSRTYRDEDKRGSEAAV